MMLPGPSGSYPAHYADKAADRTAGQPDAQRFAPASGTQSEWRDFLDAKIPTTKGGDA